MKLLRPADVFGELISAYQTQRLVPFVGSGMSYPLCSNWPNLVSKLRAQVGLVSADAAQFSGVPFDPAATIRQADEAMVLLRSRPICERIQIVDGSGKSAASRSGNSAALRRKERAG